MLWKIIKKIFTTLVTLLILTVVSLGAYLALSTSRAERQPEQKKFLSGSAEMPAPGTYRGQTNLPLSSWRGKIFNPGIPGGANLFAKNGTFSRHYSFLADTAPATRDSGLTAVQLNYNLDSNPWYVRIFLIEEIVKTAENKYLGKSHVRVLPNQAFTLGFFTLQPAGN